MNVKELRKQHDALRALACQLLDCVANDDEPKRLGGIRWQLARELLVHLALEDRFFYPATQRQSDAALREEAMRLQVEMAPLSEAFSAYMARWNEDRIDREWAGFCRESREIMMAIINRIDKEELLFARLYAQADQGRSTLVTHAQSQ